MGGRNSSRWPAGYKRREIVENCRLVSIKDLYRLGILVHGERDVAGGKSIALRSKDSVVHLELDGTDIEHPICRVKCYPPDGRNVSQKLALEIIQSRYGTPYFFRCPLKVGGACLGRTAILFLPPEAVSFGCRTCHKLSYRSVLRCEAGGARRRNRPKAKPSDSSAAENSPPTGSADSDGIGSGDI